MNNVQKYAFFSFPAIIIIIAAIALLSGTRPQARSSKKTQIITDMSGRQVHIPENPSRILSLSAMADDIIIKLGLSGKLVAIDQYGTIIPGTEKAAVVGKGSALSIEKILELKVDIAFIWWYQDDVAAMLEKYSIPVVRFKSYRLDNYPKAVMLSAKCLKAEKAARKLIRNFNKQLKTLSKLKTNNAPKVYLELYTPYKTAGRNTYANDLIEAAGGYNIAGNISGTGIISAEDIILKSPEIILFINNFTTADKISSRPGFKTLPAVRKKQIYGIDRKYFIAGFNPAESVNKIKQIINKRNQN